LLRTNLANPAQGHCPCSSGASSGSRALRTQASLPDPIPPLTSLSAQMAAHTSPPTDRTRRRNNTLLVQLKAVLAQPLPDPEQTYECAAALHQLSWVMRLQVGQQAEWGLREDDAKRRLKLC